MRGWLSPAVALALVVVLAQWRVLYAYYFGLGYAWGRMPFVARVLAGNLLSLAGAILYLLPLIYGICLLSISGWRDQLGEIVAAAWLALGFPALIILTRGVYTPGYYACWTVTGIVLLATLMPRRLTGRHRQLFLSILLVLIAGASMLQFARASFGSSHAETPREQDGGAARGLAMREFHTKLANVILAQPEPREYKLIFTEGGEEFWNLVYFDVDANKALSLRESSAFFSVHDSYYRNAFGTWGAGRVVQHDIERLEQTPGTIVVGNCEPREVVNQPWLVPNPAVEYIAKGNSLAAEIAVQLNEYVMQSPRWKCISRLDSPFGCMFVYRHSPRPVSATEKWSAVESSSALEEIPLALALGPSVRMYDYSGEYKPEMRDGLYTQWLPSGEQGLRFSLFSDQERAVVFQARAVAGPSRSRDSMTLVVSVGRDQTRVHVAGETEIRATVHLKPGLNRIALAVEEMRELAGAAPARGRDASLELISPRLVPKLEAGRAGPL